MSIRPTDLKESAYEPSETSNLTESEKILKLTSTPKSKPKQKKFTPNLENSNSNNTLRKIKKMNSKNKFHTGLKKTITVSKKEEKKNTEENDKFVEENDNIINTNELNDISVENKIKEIKIENVILTDNKKRNKKKKKEKKKKKKEE